MPKEDGEDSTKVDLVHEVDAKLSFVYYDRHNKVDFAGQFDVPNPLVKDSQLHRLTYERELDLRMNSVERDRRQLPVSSYLYNLSSHADLLKRYQVAVLSLAQHVFEVRGLSVVLQNPERAADFERCFLA